MDSEVVRLVRAIATLEQGPGIHPVGFGLERRLCDLLGVESAQLRRTARRAETERLLVAAGTQGPTGEQRRHPYHLSAKGWGLAGVLVR